VESNGDGDLYARIVTPIFDNNSAARWGKQVMKLPNRMHFCIVYHGQQADGTAGRQTPMCGGLSYLPRDDILPPPAENIIDDNNEEELDDIRVTRSPNPRWFPTQKTGFQTFKQKRQKRMIRQQQYHEVIRNRALGFFADYAQSPVADENVATRA
jgi:hypothetical protein